MRILNLSFKDSDSEGFTFTEILIVITIFLLIIGAVYSAYVLSHQAYKEGEARIEVLQNGRVVIERITREIRQTREIVGALPAALDSEIPAGASNEIELEDGHISEFYHYIHYFKENNLVKREVRGYYFSGDPEEALVPWNSIPPEGQTLKTKVLEEAKIIGECVADLKFWGLKTLYVYLKLEKGGKSLELREKVFGRNI